jgi:hypothetical protein
MVERTLITDCHENENEKFPHLLLYGDCAWHAGPT